MIDKEKFIKILSDRLEDLKDIPLTPKSVSVEKILLFIVDKVRDGNFRGIISVKINDNDIYAPRIDQQEVVVESTYKNIDL
jgi:hypothetical protein